jgi:hypothetical protein
MFGQQANKHVDVFYDSLLSKRTKVKKIKLNKKTATSD